MLNTGEVLEKYLKGRMSMTDLAGLLGITPQYISSVLNNTKRPSKNFLEKFYISHAMTKKFIVIWLKKKSNQI